MNKFAVIVDIDGYYVEPELVPISTYGVTPIYEQPVPTEPEEEEEQEQPEPILVGYRVAVPVTPGLYKPRFDIDAWQSALEAHEDAMNDYRDELAAYDPESEDELPQPPSQVDLRQFWVEGLTTEELDAIRNAPQPVSLNNQVTQLQAESVDTMLALTEVYETTAQQDAAREQEGIDTMLALTEAYELILLQQGAITDLTARIESLEGGGS